jgi:impB/mucB/samB family protein
MRLLHLYRPHLPLELARARASEPFPVGPLILGGRPWDPGPVVDADPAARALGVRRGMPLGSAHRLVPDAFFIDPDPEADQAIVEAAFEALAAFSPGIAGSADATDPAFGLFEVQIDGLEPLWGPELVLIGRLVAALGRALACPGGSMIGGADATDGPVKAGAEIRAGIAGTRFSATIAAVRAHPAEPLVVPVGGEAAFLAPHPSVLLTQDPDVRARLTRFGLRRIGAVAELARSALVARFGEEGARIHARARGEELEPFRPRLTPERLKLMLPIEPAAEDLEPLRFVLHRLAIALTDQLVSRGLAASRARLHLDLDLAFARAGTPQVLDVEQRFPEPTADAEAIERLLFARLERTPPPAAVASLGLELDGTTPAAGQQLPLFNPQAARGARLDWQLARLALTFGEDRVRRVDLVDPEATLPEARWRWRPVIADERVVTSSDRGVAR